MWFIKIKVKLLLAFLILFSTHAFGWEVTVDKTITELPLIRNDKNQTVYDPNTNLIWLDDIKTKKIKKQFYDAYSYCEKLNLFGYKDWRLPTISELLTILDRKNSPAIKSSFKNIGFTNDNSYYDSYYWSSTRYKYRRGFSWNYCTCFKKKCYSHIDKVISHSMYTDSEHQDKLYFCCVRKDKNILPITFDQIVSLFIKKQISLIKKPHKVTLKKDEFETTKSYIQRIKKSEQEYKFAIMKYEEKIKKEYPKIKKMDVKNSIEYK